MRILAFIFLLLTHVSLASQDFEQLYLGRVRNAEKVNEIFQKEVITSLSARIDVSREVQKKIQEKLARLETSPPGTFDPFRDEFLPHMALIIPPEQHFTEQQAQSLAGSLSLENLSPLVEKLAPLRQCVKKWEGIFIRADGLMITVNQMTWFQKEWDEFFEKISTQLARFKLTPSDLQDVFEQFLYFHKQLSGFQRGDELLATLLSEIPATLPESLAYLETMQKELSKICENRAKLLWEILWESFNKLVPPSSIPKNYSDLSKAEYKNSMWENNPIKIALNKLLNSVPVELPTFSHAISTPRDNSTPLGTPRFNSFTQAFAASPRSSPAPDDTNASGLVRSHSTSSKSAAATTSTSSALPYASSAPQVISRRHSTVPRLGQMFQQHLTDDDDDDKMQPQNTQESEQARSLSTSDRAPQKDNEPEITVLRDGSEKNQNFIAKFKAAFEKSEVWSEKRKKFKEHYNYLRNIKFILQPLKEYDAHCNAFRDSLLTSSDKTKELLLPPAHLLMLGQPLRRMPQTIAYKVCSLKSYGLFCFGVPEKVQQSTVSLTHTRDGLQYSVKETYPFQIDQKLALESLEVLFGIQSNCPLLLAIDNIRVVKPPAALGNKRPADICADYLAKPNNWPIEKTNNFVMVQRTNPHVTLPAWLDQVCSAERSYNELCPRSYGQTTLFSLLTQLKVASIDYCLEPQEGKLVLKRVGFTPFQFPAFQSSQNNEQIAAENAHLFIGSNVLYLLPGAYEVIPEEVKKDFTNNNIELICANWLADLSKYQKYFTGLVQSYGLDDTQDELGIDIDKDLSVARALGLSVLFRPNSIDRLISRFHRIVDLLKSPTITYVQLHKVLEPQEAVIYEVFQAGAEKRIRNKNLIKFFKKLMPAKTNQLKAMCKQMESMGEIPPYSSQDLNQICETTQACLNAAQRNRQAVESSKRMSSEKATEIDEETDDEKLEGETKLLTFEDILKANIPQNLQEFYKRNFDWANRTGFFGARLSKKAYIEMADSGERKDLYETLAPENPLAPSIVSWDSTPVLQTGVASYVGAVLEMTHPVNAMVQDFCVNANLDSLGNFTTLALVGQLCSIGDLPQQCHQSWYLNLKAIADNQFLVLPPATLDFMERSGFMARERAEALSKAQFSVRNNYNTAIGNASVALKPPAVGSNRTKRSSILSVNINAITSLPPKIPGFLFRTLMGLTNCNELSPEEKICLTAVCDLLLLPSYNGLENLANHPEKDPGSLGVASNQLGKRGPWELHIKGGEHYILSLSEACVTLVHSPESLTKKTRSILANHVVPLFLLKWFTGLKNHTPEVQFHPWFVASIFEKFTRLQILASSNECLSFEDIFSTLEPILCFMNKKMLRTYSNAPTQNPANKHQETLDGLLGYMRKRKEPEDVLFKRVQQKNLKDLNPIESTDSDLDTTFRLAPQSNVQSFLDNWDNAREKEEDMPPMGLNNAAREVFSRFVPKDHAPEIVLDILDMVQKFQINLDGINPELWNNPQIIEGLLRLEAPLPILQMAYTLRAGKPITLARPADNSFAVSGTAGDISLLTDCISLHAKTGYLTNKSRNVAPLRELDISGNQLRSLDNLMPFLRNLTTVTTLRVAKNPLHNLRPLHTLTQLVTLDISNTYCHAHPRLTPVVTLFNDFLSNSDNGPHWPDVRLLVAPNFLQLLRSKIPHGQQPNTELLTQAHAALIPLPNLNRLVNTPDGPCVKREEDLPINADILLRKLAEKTQQEDYDIDLIISILHRLGENQWSKALNIKNEGLAFLSDKVFARIQSPYAPRAIAFKMLYALKFGFPIGTIPHSLAFHSVTNQADNLRRLEITNLCPPSEFLRRLDQFEGLEELTFDNTNRPQILEELPRLPRLTHLVITGNKLTSLRGLLTPERNLKFTDKLVTFILANNDLTDLSNLELLLNLLRLSCLDLSSNKLTVLPALGNLRHLVKQDYRRNKIPLNLLKGYKNTNDLFFTPQSED